MHSEKIDHERIALVTAGASGIGRAIADRLLQLGFVVHVCDIDGAALDEFRSIYPGATASQVDVSDFEQVNQWFDDLADEHSRLDVLVNNVGIAGPTARVEDIHPDDWDRTITVGINAALYVTRRAVPWLKQSGGGSIINMASTAGLFGWPMRSPYVAAMVAFLVSADGAKISGQSLAVDGHTESLSNPVDWVFTTPTRGNNESSLV